MKFLLALLLMLPAAAQQKLTSVDEAGVQKIIAGAKGKVLVVNFWATWCEPCRAEMPALVAMQKRLAAKGLQLVTISADEPEAAAEAAKFIGSKGIPLPAYIKNAKNDEQFINAMDPKWSGAVPALFIFDKSGKKVRSFIGEADLKAVEASILKLL